MKTDTTSQLNFSLIGFTSIQIGIYILLAAYAIETLLLNFMETDTLGLSSEINLVIAIASITFFTVLFSFFAMFFKGKRNAKKQQLQLWNQKSISGICILFSIICFMIPSYWYSALVILGVAHITYGVVVKA